MIEKSHNFSFRMLLYTAGLFRSGTCSYSIVKEINGTQFELVCENRLPDNVGIFLAEISAIKDSISYSINKQKRSIIFSNSLSAIEAIKKNDKNIYYNLINHSEFGNRILLLWIASHIGILGNEASTEQLKN